MYYMGVIRVFHVFVMMKWTIGDWWLLMASWLRPTAPAPRKHVIRLSGVFLSRTSTFRHQNPDLRSSSAVMLNLRVAILIYTPHLCLRHWEGTSVNW